MISTQSPIRPPRWQTVLAFAVIYLVWGSTYLAIRVGVHAVPPFLLAGVRFLVAGLILFAWVAARRIALPTAREWASIALISVLIFVCDYGVLFWAEQRVPSGISALLMSTIPMFIGLLEILFLKTQRLTPRLALAFLLGMAGVGVLMSKSMAGPAGASDWRAPAATLLFASLSWSAGVVLTRALPLPASRVMSSAAQNLAGGILLTIIALVLGEFRGFRLASLTPAALVAFAYLVFAGSILGFTTYSWLIHHQSPTKVGTYAYVNPVVAVILGATLGGEAIGGREVAGAVLVLLSVLLITTIRSGTRGPIAEEDVGVLAGGDGKTEPQEARS